MLERLWYNQLNHIFLDFKVGMLQIVNNLLNTIIFKRNQLIKLFLIIGKYSNVYLKIKELKEFILEWIIMLNYLSKLTLQEELWNS